MFPLAKLIVWEEVNIIDQLHFGFQIVGADGVVCAGVWCGAACGWRHAAAHRSVCVGSDHGLL